MSRRDKPNYGIYPINLTNAGQMDMTIEASKIVMVSALTTAGAFAPTALVTVQIGKALGDAIPVAPNGKISVEDAFEFVRFSWAAQPNIIATFLISDDRNGAGINVDAPVASLTVAGAITDNVTQFGSNPVQTGTGASGLGVPRVTVSNDSFPSNIALNALPLSGAGAQIQPNVIGSTSSFAASTSGVSSATILAPASNVHGVIIRQASAWAGGNTSGFYAGTSAPTSFSSNPGILVVSLAAGYQAVTLSHDIYLPPGQGVYWNSQSTYPYSITYDVL
jgi:hypothetical protein